MGGGCEEWEVRVQWVQSLQWVQLGKTKRALEVDVGEVCTMCERAYCLGTLHLKMVRRQFFVTPILSPKNKK